MLLALAFAPVWAQNDTETENAQPELKPQGTVMRGTYYADKFVGRKTSNGEIFRQNQYTAAHKSIPLGTYLLVTNPATSLTIVVRVNDRCPKRGILDLTKLAANSLGIRGSGKVIVTALDAETGYAIWVNQDTLAMSAEEYYAFRDRSRNKRISPYPISPTDRKEQAAQKAAKPVVTPKKKAVEKPAKSVEPEPIDTLPPPLPDPEPQPAVPKSSKNEIKGPLYDIELCIVNTQMAAQREASRLPKDLQEKALFRRNQLNNQVHVILSLADTRSHAVRTQAMLIEEYPESCLIPHEK